MCVCWQDSMRFKYELYFLFHFRNVFPDNLFVATFQQVSVIYSALLCTLCVFLLSQHHVTL